MTDPQNAFATAETAPAQARSSRGRTTAIVVSALVGGLLFHGGIGAAGVGFFAVGQASVVASLTGALEQKAAEDAAEAVATAVEEEAAAQRLGEAAALADEKTRRESILLALEKAVHEDAEALVADGSLEGPILEAVCFPGGDASTVAITDLSDGDLECMAVTESSVDEYIGYTYIASITWADGTYSFEIL
jgi:hypothetical protein